MIACQCRQQHQDETDDEYRARLAHFNQARPRDARTVDHPHHHKVCGACQWFHCPVYEHALNRLSEGSD